jgi:pimeloyl-ACP methyl ester carboxylesterase
VVAHSRGAYEVVREITDRGRHGVAMLVLIGWANPTDVEVSDVVPADDEELMKMCRSFVGDRQRAEGSVLSAARLDFLATYAMRRFKEAGHLDVRVNPEMLSRVDCPTLLVLGSDDWTVTPGAADGLVSALPDAEVRVIEGAGHWPMLEQPKELVRCILQFAEQRL